MGRQQRSIRDWKEIRVDSLPVAPHRYLYSGTIDADGNRLPDIDLAESYDEAKACVPYREGEVILVQWGAGYKRALIHDVLAHARDNFGDRREAYNVQLETAKGYFSKVWTRAYPGYIQRGYQRAGLAPDMPEPRRRAESKVEGD